MATIIKIKRTTGATAPSGLNQGELAYVYDTSATNNGVGGNGYRLFIGDPTSSSNSAIEIGGEYFTNLLDHSHGVVTANSGVIVDSSKKVDEWNVDDITIDGNTITNNSLVNNLTLSNTSGCINFTGNQLICVTDPTSGQDAATKAYVDSQVTAQDLDLTADTGSASIDLDSETLNITGGTGLSTTVDNLTKQLTIDLDNTAVTPGSYGSTTAIPRFTVDQQGRLTAASTVNVATTLSTAAETGTGSVDLLSDTLTILAGEGINTVASGTNITISGENASDTNKGIASFDSTDFTVTSGAVAVNTITLGSSSLNPGATTTDIAGLTSLDVDDININGSTIYNSSLVSNLSINSATGCVDFNGLQVANIATPVLDTDAANKAYVDSARSGLDVKQSVKVATTGNIALSGTQTVDGVALSVGDRILVKDQTTASENGIYVVASSFWTRATDADADAEVTSGMFTFVEQGSVNSDTGFVLTTDGTITVGTTGLNFTLFSASGTLIAGNGLSKNGDTLEVNVALTGGIEISADELQLKSSVAGDGLTYSSGVIDVVGTSNRIDVSANAIDISTSYVGQTTITTLGTITTGTWNGDVIDEIYGGTGLNSYTTGDILYASGSNTLATLAIAASGKILQSDGTNVTYGDIDGGTY